jgi:hypothetical protein
MLLGWYWALFENWRIISSYFHIGGTLSTISNSGIRENQISTSNPQKRKTLDVDMSNDSNDSWTSPQKRADLTFKIKCQHLP